MDYTLYQQTLLEIEGENPILYLCKEAASHVNSNLKSTARSSQGDATGGRTSPAAKCIIWFLKTHTSLLSQCTVVELGCGIGLSGVYAARHAPQVVLTDGDEEMLQLAAATARLNQHSQQSGCSSSSGSSSSSSASGAGPASCSSQLWLCRLPWGPLAAAEGDADADHDDGAVAWLQQHATCLSASEPSGEQQGKGSSQGVHPAGGASLQIKQGGRILVVGADLIYYRSGIQQLLHTTASLLQPPAAAPGSMAVLAFSPRIDTWLELIEEGASQAGLEVRYIDVAQVVPSSERATGWFKSVKVMVAWLPPKQHLDQPGAPAGSSLGSCSNQQGAAVAAMPAELSPSYSLLMTAAQVRQALEEEHAPLPFGGADLDLDLDLDPDAAL